MGALAPIAAVISAVSGAIGTGLAVKNLVDPPEVEVPEAYSGSSTARTLDARDFETGLRNYMGFVGRTAPRLVDRNRAQLTAGYQRYHDKRQQRGRSNEA